jgi:muramoyltetrapeptide carboxypeptidase LdcA involved in peptidoglycan recycling
MAGFSHLRCFPEALREYGEVLLSGEGYELRPFAEWSDGYMDWREIGNRGKIAGRRTDDLGHRWINKGKRRTGLLWGGCVELLDMMNGTFAWPGIDFWEGRILMLETSEDKPSPEYVGFFLRNLGIQGILSRLGGLLVAKPRSYSPEEKARLDAEIRKVAIGEFGCEGLTTVTNVDFGHTDPRHIMPLGIALDMDPERERLRFAESLFA